MNPSDLVPLYVPVFVCWFLIWLTKAAEGVGESTQKTLVPDREVRKGARAGDANTSSRGARTWNVSHFFRYR
jgi:hypothetical protein